MIAFSSTKSLKASVASALALGALSVTPAFAQFATTGTYVPTGMDATARTAVAAPGNSESLTAFQIAVASAYTSNTGGDITFDSATVSGNPPGITSITSTYGTAQANTLTITQPVSIAAADAAGNGYGSFSTGLDAANVTSAGTNANYLGFSNIPVAATTYNFNMVFSQSLSDFGIMVINRGAARNVSMIVTLSNGTTVTPTSGFATSGGANPLNPVFFEYAATGSAKITGVDFTSTGYTRFDDLGFVAAAAPAATPEPSQVAGLGLGFLGLGVLALKARKRTALGS